MKSFKINFLIALASIVMLGSCSDDDTDPPKSEEEQIGSGVAWKLSTATANGISVTSLIPTCLMDDLITFNYASNGNTGVVDAGAVKCDESEPQTADFTWTFNDATDVLTVNTDLFEVPGATGDIKVMSITSSELVLSQSVAIPSFGTQEVMLTLVH